MATSRFTFDDRQVKANVKAIARQTPRRAANALHAEAQIEMTEMRRRTPVDQRPNAPHPGQLRASGYVAEPEIHGRTIRQELGFGGAASDYAVHVHEDLEALHPVGQAKYAESVLVESAPYMAGRVARRMDLGDMVTGS